MSLGFKYFEVRRKTRCSEIYRYIRKDAACWLSINAKKKSKAAGGDRMWHEERGKLPYFLSRKGNTLVCVVEKECWNKIGMNYRTEECVRHCFDVVYDQILSEAIEPYLGKIFILWARKVLPSLLTYLWT